MLDELASLKPALPRDVEAKLREIINTDIAEDGTFHLNYRAFSHWTTPIGSRQLEQRGGAVTSWELVIILYIADTATAWNKAYERQSGKSAKSRNDDRRRAQVGNPLPNIEDIHSSRLKQRSARWKTLIWALGQSIRSTLYEEIDKRRLLA
jgi:hypothetical protein